MANYTDIPTGEEQGLVSDTAKSESGKKDTNFYLKLACVGLLCVVAFMSGNVHSRNTATSMVNSAWGRCHAMSATSSDGFCPQSDSPCHGESTGIEECIEYGGGLFETCLRDEALTEKAAQFFNNRPQAFEESFARASGKWKPVSCSQQGYTVMSRPYTFQWSPDYFFTARPALYRDLAIPSTGSHQDTAMIYIKN